jgi:hypothetical protein
VKRLFRYPWRSLFLDYAGSGAGLAASLGSLGFLQLAAPVAWVATAVAGLFLVYFARTVCRQLTRLELDEDGIRVKGPLDAALRWDGLRLLRLDYYSTRRDAERRTMQGGWMQLTLRDARRTIRIDSALEDFAELASLAAQEASHRGLALDAATASNLEALGGGNGGTRVPPYRGV